MRTTLRLLLRIAPLILAFLLPYLTPGIEDRAPYLGAAWLRADPGRWAGRPVWVLIRLPRDAVLPAAGEIVAADSLSDRLRSPTDRGAYLWVRPEEDGRLFVLGSRWRTERARIWWLGNFLAGAAMLLAAAVLFRPAGGGRVEVRPWIL